MQLVWLLEMDQKILAGIQDAFCSPFRPAEILRNMRVEFNIWRMNAFQSYLQSLNGDG